MIQIRHILCPIDYGACSRRAFAEAMALARWYKASVTALHVTEQALNADGMMVPGNTVLARPTRRQLETDVERFVAAWRDATVSVAFAVEEGPVAERIMEAARRLGADLIVMGIHGRLSLRYIALGALGSVTLEVIRTAPCPTLVVPPGMHDAGEVTYQQIVCPVDFGEASLRAVEYALSLAQESGATLVLARVIDPADKERRREAYDTRPRPLNEAQARHALSALVPEDARQYCRPVELLAEGTPHTEILRIAEDVQADVIVMGVGARSAAEMMLLGSTADPVLRSAPCPVLTVSASPR